MKYVVRMSEEQRQFIVALLSETKDDFVRAFRDLAKSGSIKGKRKFASDWISLAELAFAKAEENVNNNEKPDIHSVLSIYNEKFAGMILKRVRVSSVATKNAEKCLKYYGITGVELVLDQVKHEYISDPDSISLNFSTIFQFGHFSSLLNRYFERRFKEGGEL